MAIDLGHRISQPPQPPADLGEITVQSFDRLADAVSQLSGVSNETTWGEVEQSVLTQDAVTRAVQNALLEQPHRAPSGNALIRQMGRDGPGLAQSRRQADRPMFSELEAQKTGPAPRPSGPGQPLLGQGAITGRMAEFGQMVNSPWAWLDEGIKDTARKIENFKLPQPKKKAREPEDLDSLFGNGFQNRPPMPAGLFGNLPPAQAVGGPSAVAEVQKPVPQDTATVPATPAAESDPVVVTVPPAVPPDPATVNVSTPPVILPEAPAANVPPAALPELPPVTVPNIEVPEQQAYAVNVAPSVLSGGFPEGLFTANNPGIVQVLGLESFAVPYVQAEAGQPSLLPGFAEDSVPLRGGVMDFVPAAEANAAAVQPSIQTAIPSPVLESRPESAPAFSWPAMRADSPVMGGLPQGQQETVTRRIHAFIGGGFGPEASAPADMAVNPAMGNYFAMPNLSAATSPLMQAAASGAFQTGDMLQKTAAVPLPGKMAAWPGQGLSGAGSGIYPAVGGLPDTSGEVSSPVWGLSGSGIYGSNIAEAVRPGVPELPALSGSGIMGGLMAPAETETGTGGLGLLAVAGSERPGLAPALDRPAPLGGESSSGINPVMGSLAGGGFGNSVAVSADRDLTTEFKEQSLKTDTAMFGMLDDPRSSDFGRFLQSDVLNREDGVADPNVRNGLFSLLGILTGIGAVMNALGIDPGALAERLRPIGRFFGFFGDLGGLIGSELSNLVANPDELKATMRESIPWAIPGAIVGGMMGGVKGALVGAGLGIAFGTFLKPRITDAINERFDGNPPPWVNTLSALAPHIMGGALLGGKLGGVKGVVVGALAGALFGAVADPNVDIPNSWKVAGAAAAGILGGGYLGFRLGGLKGAVVGALMGGGLLFATSALRAAAANQAANNAEAVRALEADGLGGVLSDVAGYMGVAPTDVMARVASPTNWDHAVTPRGGGFEVRTGPVDHRVLGGQRIGNSDVPMYREVSRGFESILHGMPSGSGLGDTAYLTGKNALALVRDPGNPGGWLGVALPRGQHRVEAPGGQAVPIEYLGSFLWHGSSMDVYTEPGATSVPERHNPLLAPRGGFARAAGLLDGEEANIEPNFLFDDRVRWGQFTGFTSEDGGGGRNRNPVRTSRFEFPENATAADVIHVDDAIITKTGQVIRTHPEDSIYAFKGNVEINPVMEYQESVQAASPFEADEGNTVVFGNPAFSQPVKPSTNNVTQNNYSTNLPFSDFMVVGV